MAKKNGIVSIIAVAGVALLVAVLAFAVSRLYGDTDSPKPPKALSTAAGSVLRAVPSDAAAVLLLDGSGASDRVLADSTRLLEGLLASGQKGLMDYLRSLHRRSLAVSLHNSGSLVPLVVAAVPVQDSTLEAAAGRAGLKYQWQDGVLVASRSETFVKAAVRHMESGQSVLGSGGLGELVGATQGPAVLYVSHAHAGKLLQIYAGSSWRQHASFVKNLTSWSAWSLEAPKGGKRISIQGTALPGEGAASFFAASAALPSQEALFPEVLPYFTATAISVPVGDAAQFLEMRRTLEDGAGRLGTYNKALKARAGRPLSPEEWFLSLHPQEVVRASFAAEDGIVREALLVRTEKELGLKAESANPYKGCLELLLGPDFAVQDSVCASLGNKWSVYADIPTVRFFTDGAQIQYKLKDRLADASVKLPGGFVAYSSLSDNPLLADDLLSPQLAGPLKRFVAGAGYAPAIASLAPGTRPQMQLSVENCALKGSQVQVLERDTVVVVPTGLFPVKNHVSGQTNYLYQNKHLSICLNDENDKGVWGIPFKESLCGRVESIDYYQNGKYQYLFAAGNKLYLLDRLGHWVAGFPVALPKEVLLGPDAYDFTGAGGYTVMILHKDNTLSRYNLHGQKPEGWKGIAAPETVKDLPELLELRGKRYWVVRTSIQTLVYPFEGGEPLVQGQGGKMIKPDAVLTPVSKGFQATCYDGKSRDFKLN